MELNGPVENFHRVFVYGSLKSTFYNNVVMRNAGGVLIRTDTTPADYTMLDLGSYPAVIREGNTSIKGEVWEVATLAPLDRLEGYPSYYTREQIKLNKGDDMPWMYMLTSRRGIRNTVDTGIWLESA